MDKYRVLFAVLVAVFLLACNLAYLASASGGIQKQMQFAQQMDQPSIKFLSLALLVGVVIFAWQRPKQEG